MMQYQVLFQINDSILKAIVICVKYPTKAH